MLLCRRVKNTFCFNWIDFFEITRNRLFKYSQYSINTDKGNCIFKVLQIDLKGQSRVHLFGTSLQNNGFVLLSVNLDYCTVTGVTKCQLIKHLPDYGTVMKIQLIGFCLPGIKQHVKYLGITQRFCPGLNVIPSTRWLLCVRHSNHYVNCAAYADLSTMINSSVTNVQYPVLIRSPNHVLVFPTGAAREIDRPPDLSWPCFIYRITSSALPFGVI